MSPGQGFHTHKHENLQVTFKGVLLKKEGVDVVQYRGLQYASISERFAAPELVKPKSSNGQIEAVDFGPECPQIRHDIKQLFCTPSHYPDEIFEQDEFRCLNLTVTTPADARKPNLPVMIWIHGGGQTMSNESPSSRISDTARFVADSINHDMPIIVVGIHYRLNVFGLGDGKGARNLALLDQSSAVEWVRKYIDGFGGNPDDLTLAGESAGGLNIHAHTIIGTPAKRAILQSGTLYTKPPLPLEDGVEFVNKFETTLKARCGKSMRDAPVDMVVETLIECGVSSMSLELTPELQGWQDRDPQVNELMIGDCEFESILWLNALRNAKPEDIARCIDALPREEAAQVKALYGIDGKSSKDCRRGALNLIGDYKFAEPPARLAAKWRSSGKMVYQYLMDEVNPFRQSLGSFHGVDLLYLFGDYDLSKTPALEKTGQEMRRRWIRFVNGKRPWNGNLCIFGPLGVYDELQEASATNRRRWENFRLIDQLRPKLDSIIEELCEGRLKAGSSRM